MDKLKILTERFFLRSPNINVCFRILISRNIGKETFDEALGNVCKRHPILNCSIEIDNDYIAWFLPNNCRVVTDYFQSDEMPDWQIWHKKADNIPFDFLNGPLARMCVIWGENQTEIIILGHHIIGDGIGYFNLAKDILLALDKKLETTPQILTANNEFIKKNKLGFILKLYAKKLNKEWEKNRIRFSEDEYRSFFYEYRKNFIPGSYFYSINEDNLQKIIQKCKVEKISVNEIVTSAFAMALFSGKKLRVGIAVNTRNELISKPHNCMGNYLSATLAKIKHIPKNEFMSDVKKIVKVIRRRLNNRTYRHLVVNILGEFDNDLIESIMYASYGNYQLPLSKRIGSLIARGLEDKALGITNLGIQELKDYDSFKLLDMQFIAPVFPSNILSVCVITVNNKLNICLRYNINELDTDSVINIYNKAIDLLC